MYDIEFIFAKKKTFNIASWNEEYSDERKKGIKDRKLYTPFV